MPLRSEHRAELKLSRHLQIVLCPTFLGLFSIFSLTEIEISEQASRQVQQQNNQTKVCTHARRRIWRYYNVNRDENPQSENEEDNPSLKVVTLSEIASLLTVIEIKQLTLVLFI